MGNATSTTTQPPPTPPPPPAEEPSTFTCEICIEPVLSNQKFRNDNLCVHPFCVDCIVKYIQVKVEDDAAAEIRCPGLDCDRSLDPLFCRPILPPPLFLAWCDVLCERTLLSLDRCYCPNGRCSAVVLNECGGGVRKSKCPNCKRFFCFRCKIPWHAGYRCEESGELRDPNDVALGVLAERNKWKRCPSCNYFVERIEGCRIVKCRCGMSFCYECGRKMSQHWRNCNNNADRCANCCFGMFVIFLIALQLLFLTKILIKSSLSV